jgi:hypothetical protein
MSGAPGRRAGLWLFLLLSAIYLLTFGGHFYSGDGIEMWRTSVSLVLRGELALEQDTPGRTWGYPGADGRRYSPYALGLSLVEAPFYVLGRTVSASLPLDDRGRERLMWASTTSVNVFISAAGALLLYLIGIGVGYSRRASAGVSMLYGLGTMAWVYSKHDFAEPLCVLCLLGAACLLVRLRPGAGIGLLILAGAFNGYSFFTKYQMVIYTPILVAYLLLATPVRERRGVSLAKALAAFLLPGLLFGLANLYVNHAKFGDWLTTGYDRQGEIFAGWGYFPVGLFGLLLSSGKGLFWYNPLLLAVPFAWPAFHRRTPALSWLAGGIFGATLLMFSPLWWWHGDWAWGPRYLLIPLPFLVLPLLGWLDTERGPVPDVAKRRRRRRALAILLLLAFGVNFLGLGVNFFYYVQAITGMGKVHDQWHFQPGLSPLRYHAHMVKVWILGAAGLEIPDFRYRSWKDGAFSEERISMDQNARGPDFFFARPRDSLLQQAILAITALLLGAAALFSAMRLRAALGEGSP